MQFMCADQSPLLEVPELGARLEADVVDLSGGHVRALRGQRYGRHAANSIILLRNP